jgi:hypothetical protein
MVAPRDTQLVKVLCRRSIRADLDFKEVLADGVAFGRWRPVSEIIDPVAEVVAILWVNKGDT